MRERRQRRDIGKGLAHRLSVFRDEKVVEGVRRTMQRVAVDVARGLLGRKVLDAGLVHPGNAREVRG